MMGSNRDQHPREDTPTNRAIEQQAERLVGAQQLLQALESRTDNSLESRITIGQQRLTTLDMLVTLLNQLVQLNTSTDAHSLLSELESINKQLEQTSQNLNIAFTKQLRITAHKHSQQDQDACNQKTQQIASTLSALKLDAEAYLSGLKTEQLPLQSQRTRTPKLETGKVIETSYQANSKTGAISQQRININAPTVNIKT